MQMTIMNIHDEAITAIYVLPDKSLSLKYARDNAPFPAQDC